METSIRKMGAPVGEQSPDLGVVLVDTKLHPTAAVMRACYALADVANFQVGSGTEGVIVRIFPVPGTSHEIVADRFRSALIDFTIREEIEARTAGLRELIWKTAFAETRGLG